jgi:glycerol kinase
VQETTALGAAFLAGLSAGVWSSKEEAASAWSLDREVTPRDRAAADGRYDRWRQAVQRARNWESRG